MSISRQLASRLRQSVQGCTVHLHGPVQAWAAVEKACSEGKAKREEVAHYVIESCTNRIEELLAAGTAHDDPSILKERKTRNFVERLLLGGDITRTPQTPILAVGIFILNATNQHKIALLNRENQPYGWEIPGDITITGETAETTARRCALETTGLRLQELQLLGVYSNHAYDDQSHISTLIYSATADGALKINGTDCIAKYFSLDDLPELAFDHGEIVSNYFLSKVKGGLSYA